MLRIYIFIWGILWDTNPDECEDVWGDDPQVFKSSTTYRTHITWQKRKEEGMDFCYYLQAPSVEPLAIPTPHTHSCHTTHISTADI